MPIVEISSSEEDPKEDPKEEPEVPQPKPDIEMQPAPVVVEEPVAEQDPMEEIAAKARGRLSGGGRTKVAG